MICPTAISIDPLSGDLFTDDTCTAELRERLGLARLRSGRRVAIYFGVRHTVAGSQRDPGVRSGRNDLRVGLHRLRVPNVAEISGTNGPTTPTVTTLPGLQLANLGLLAGGTGAGTYLIADTIRGRCHRRH